MQTNDSDRRRRILNQIAECKAELRAAQLAYQRADSLSATQSRIASLNGRLDRLESEIQR